MYWENNVNIGDVLTFLNIIVVGMLTFLIFQATQQSAKATEMAAKASEIANAMTEILLIQEKRRRLLYKKILLKNILNTVNQWDKTIKEMINEPDQILILRIPKQRFSETELIEYLDESLIIEIKETTDKVEKTWSTWTEQTPHGTRLFGGEYHIIDEAYRLLSLIGELHGRIRQCIQELETRENTPI